MKSLFGEKIDPELQAREAMRRKKWSKALEYYGKKVEENERDFALWNLVGDLHMNNGARTQAVEAWRRALDGYALEGLHENVLGIARKILRRTPDEEDVHLLLAEAYLGMEYQADCLAAFRSYLKLSKHRSESDMRSLFKKILEQPMHHLHLLAELETLFKDSGIEDIELQQRLGAYVESGHRAAEIRGKAVQIQREDSARSKPEAAATAQEDEEGLLTLNGMDSYSDDSGMETTSYTPMMSMDNPPVGGHTGHFDGAEAEDTADLPAGEGKDHYDLGLVYKEMGLWDAAITEFEQARHDHSVRGRATMALAECLQESRDYQGALQLLETEARNNESSPVEQLTFMHQLGLVHELLGNLDDALHIYGIVHERHPGYGDVESRISALQNRIGSNGESE